MRSLLTNKSMEVQPQFTSKKGSAARLLTLLLLTLTIADADPVFAGRSLPVDTNMQILCDKVKTDKKMELTDAEAKDFWLIYDSYQKDLRELNKRPKKAILSYADAYNKNTLTDQIAKSFSTTRLPPMKTRPTCAGPTRQSSPQFCPARRSRANFRSRTRSERWCGTSWLEIPLVE
jgi:hypothetical protein